MSDVQKSNSEYRSDIDGLRAFAVLPVVFFHAGFDFLPGGFVGVDVFFVISGYLISRIIIREVQDGVFSIAKFYERRVRRIIPALMVVILITLAIGWLVLKPNEVDALGKSVIAAIGFGSNIWFWRSSLEYFGPAVEFAPLLHTWSLSVEEQFYIFFPLLILFLHKVWPRYLGRAVLFFTLLSFGLACYSVYWKPNATFYLLPTRAWELGLGSLLAIYAPRVVFSSKLSQEIVGAAGFILLAAAVLLYSKSMPFPGFLALAPCLGAAMIIAAGVKTPPQSLTFLQWSSIVFIGKISYSMYLIHWPLIVFYKYLSNTGDISYSAGLLLIAVSVVLAVVSWKLVEQPFRTGSAGHRKVLINSGATMAVVAFLSFCIVRFDELKFRLTDSQQAIVDATYDVAKVPLNCTLIVVGHGLCPIGAENDGLKPYDFVLLGDSHALAISVEVSDSARLAGKSGLMMNMLCPPLLGVSRLIEPRCTEYTEVMLNEIIKRSDVKTVILHARWAYYETGTDVDGNKNDDSYNVLLVRDAQDRGGRDPSAIFARGFSRTMELLLEHGRNVVVIEGIPEVGWDVPNGLLTKSRWGLEHPDAPRIDEVRARHAGVSSVFDQYRNRPRVRFIDPIPLMCSDGECTVEVGGLPAYYDDDHLTINSSKELFRDFFLNKIFKEM